MGVEYFWLFPVSTAVIDTTFIQELLGIELERAGRLMGWLVAMSKVLPVVVHLFLCGLVT